MHRLDAEVGQFGVFYCFILFFIKYENYYYFLILLLQQSTDRQCFTRQQSTKRQHLNLLNF